MMKLTQNGLLGLFSTCFTITLFKFDMKNDQMYQESKLRVLAMINLVPLMSQVRDDALSNMNCQNPNKNSY